MSPRPPDYDPIHLDQITTLIYEHDLPWQIITTKNPETGATIAVVFGISLQNAVYSLMAANVDFTHRVYTRLPDPTQGSPGRLRKKKQDFLRALQPEPPPLGDQLFVTDGNVSDATTALPKFHHLPEATYLLRISHPIEIGVQTAALTSYLQLISQTPEQSVNSDADNLTLLIEALKQM